MKKLLIIVLIFALSFGFLRLVSNLGSASNEPVEEILTGTAEGHGGEVIVTVVIRGEDIISVEAVGKAETLGIGSWAIDELPAAIVEANSIDVDRISGATITSNAIKEAVKKALESRLNTNP